MGFRAFRLGHGKQAPWADITHVRLTGVAADTLAGQRVLEHIARLADSNGVAQLARIAVGFPARKQHLPDLEGMRVDIRHMANGRDAGSIKENKGLLELGRLD